MVEFIYLTLETTHAPSRLLIRTTSLFRYRSLHGVFGGFLPCNVVKGAFLDVFSRLNIDGAVDVGVGQHAQHGLDDIFDFFVGQPFFFAQHFLAHEAIFDVRVVDGCPELELWEFEGELFWEIYVDVELESFIGTASGSFYNEFPVKQIFFEVLLSFDGA